MSHLRDKVPQESELLRCIVEVLEAKGGSASIREIEEGVISRLNIPTRVCKLPHDPRMDGRTELQYRLAWARTNLKNYGVLRNPKRGLWQLTAKRLPEGLSGRELKRLLMRHYGD